jgi:hypothetical protein
VQFKKRWHKPKVEPLSPSHARELLCRALEAAERSELSEHECANLRLMVARAKITSTR